MSKRTWVALLSLLALFFLLWFFSAPIDRLLWIQQVRLGAGGFDRHTADSPDGTFAYYTGGAAGGGPVLVMIHGLGLSAEYWAPAMRVLGRRFPVCSVELLGFGRSLDPSIPPERYTLDLFVRQIEYLQQKFSWDRPILVGVSLGGWVAARYTLLHPRRVRALLLMAPGGLGPWRSREALENLRKRFDVRSPQEVRALINETLLTRPRWIPEPVARLLLRHASRGAYHPFLRNLREKDWINGRAAALSLPVAILWGKQDRVFPYDDARYLLRILPRARLFSLEDVGHNYLFEKKEETLKRMKEALDRLLRASASPG